MRDYHTPGGCGVQALDIRGLTHAQFMTARRAAATLDEHRYLAPAGAMYIGPQLDPPRPPTPAAARTRSSRWAAGTRRTRRLSRRLPNPPAAHPFARWADMGWTEE